MQASPIRSSWAGSLSLVEPASDHAAAGDGRTLSGVFSVFDQWQEIRSASEGHFMELISRNAFRKTIQESGDKVKVLYSRGRDPSIGTQLLGKVRSLREDAGVARYEVELFGGIPELLLDGLRAGNYGSSFRAEVVKEKFTARPSRSIHNPKGLPESVVSEFRLIDIGPTSLPAYGATSAQVRSAEAAPLHVAEAEGKPCWMLEKPSWYLESEGRS